MKVSTDSDDQAFVSELELAWTEPRADRDDLFLQIDA